MRFLWKLQEVDTALNNVRDVTANHPVLAKPPSVAQSVAKLTQRVQTSIEKCHSLKRDLRRCESDMEARNERVQVLSAMLYGGQPRGSKELQNLQRKLAEEKTAAQAGEERALALMLEIESTEKTQALQEAELRAAEEQLAISESKAAIVRRELAAEKVSLEKQRADLVAALPAPLLERYERMRKSFKRPLASVTQNACRGCHMRLPEATVARLKQGADLVYCEGCGRLLWLEE